MAKYLILWQIDTTRIPATPQERRAMYEGSLAMVEQEQAPECPLALVPNVSN
jgi:hypothetical protein